MGRRENIGTCPKHGSKFMKQEGASYYCVASTPGEISSRCFYHPTSYHPKDTIAMKKKREQERRESKPDLFKTMMKEWQLHKKNKVISRDKQRVKARERLALKVEC